MNISKKSETKERPSPRSPYREKAKGKEIKPGIYLPGLIARACVREGGGRKRREFHLKRAVSASVEEALLTFHGTRGPAPSDEALWANFAWRHGYATLLDAIYQTRSEIKDHDLHSETPVPITEYPRYLSATLKSIWNNAKGGAK